jgi:hypothetical protein
MPALMTTPVSPAHRAIITKAAISIKNMTLQVLHKSLLPGAVVLPLITLVGSLAMAQNGWFGSSLHQNLTENQSYIRGCRDIIMGNQANVYANSDLLNGPNPPIETLSGGQQVRLTGVLRQLPGYTAAQVYMDDFVFANGHPVGWVEASKLTQSSQPCYP